MEPLAIRLRPRRPEDIHADIRAQHELVWHLVDLAAEFYAADVRPMLIVGGDIGGTTIRRMGPDPVPQQLWDTLGEEQVRLAKLEAEFLEARQS